MKKQQIRVSGSMTNQRLIRSKEAEAASALEKRQALYFSPTKTFNLNVREATCCDWDIKTATNLQQARQSLKDHILNVGLFAFGELDYESALSEIDSLLGLDSNLLWIALLPRHKTEDDEICHLIAQYFIDYHTLPVDRDRLLLSLGHAFGMATIRQKTHALSLAKTGNDKIIGSCMPIQQLQKEIQKVARAQAPILISGESGTGKELVANTIHQHSECPHGPFVAVNCGALPASLIQSELFGHEKGAFTGAHQRRIGRFEAANSGTIFLDEIGDLPLDLQINLLRFLEEKIIQRVGSTNEIHVDARVIAASHIDLEQAVGEGRFREDLFYRLNVLQLRIPSLRDRHRDIELLANHFFRKFIKEKHSRLKGFTQDALQVMNHYSWPGNVRELMNRVCRAIIMSEGQMITARDLGLDRRSTERRMMTLDQARLEAEQRVISSTLLRTRNNVSQAARELGVSRPTLYRFMEKFRLPH